MGLALKKEIAKSKMMNKDEGEWLTLSRLFAEMVIQNNRPFSMGENQEMKIFLNALNPRFYSPTAEDVVFQTQLIYRHP